MPVVTNLRAYFDLLKRSNLLSQQQLVAARDAAKDYTEARGLARWLVKREWLTQWQAKQLLGGHHRLFLGKYKLLDVIGQGGMGAVLKAEQSSIHRIVALKVMAKELVKDEIAVGRFLREIQTAASLNHSNIVSVIDADCIGDRYFLVMEFVEGRDIKAWLKKYGPLPISWTCEVARQITRGLQHAHERGMVHRDIKPSNIMVTVDPKSGTPHAKIMDFGLSRLVSETKSDGHRTRTGEIMGSPDYISPEQASNAKDADIRADLFSLGCTLFQMLTGQYPFPGTNVMEKLMSRASHVPPPVSSLRPDVPVAIDEIVALLMRLDPAARIQTPTELLARLGSLDLINPATTQQPAKESLNDAMDEVIILEEDDDTLNVFLDQLSAQSADPESSSATPTPTATRESKSSMIASIIAAICVIGLFAGLATMSGGSKPKSNDEASVRTPKKETSKKTTKPKKTRD